MRKNILVTGFAICVGVAAFGQDKNMKPLELNDLSAFKPQAGNWQIVGDVMMNPNVDTHHTPAPPPAETKKGKKSKTQPAPEPPKAVTFTAGSGILLNINDDVKKDQLVSVLEHGDIELELEVMLPKGSNSGIYLQGRYEVQLFDSWGKKNPSFSDIGGIYRNWENQPGKIYMGKAPLTNAAKAPGLWQTMKISFRAPRFDATGKKISNAKFVSVELNGVKIHDNIEVPLPTGGPIENNEKALGPLVIQGDHGPVAFRNIRYKQMTENNVALTGEVTYKLYRGTFQDVAAMTAQKPFKTGTTPELSAEVIEDENNYGVIYSGSISVPATDDYNFLLTVTGGAVLKINGQTLVDVQRGDDWSNHRATLDLAAGNYPFEIINFKTASWMPPRLRFGVSTASTYQKQLQAFNSYPPSDDPTAPILIEAGSTPRLLRAFVDFNGDKKRRLTHTLGVGDPSGTHYVYDLESGNLICVWRGAFVDATPMWHDRGDGSFRPRGAAQYLFINQPLALLANPNEAFPIVSKDDEFIPKGYTIEETTGRPTFKYLYKGITIEDNVYPDDNARSITHEIKLKSESAHTGLYYKLAEGASILAMPDGAYAIDDKQYYVKSSSAAFIREVNGKKELVTAVTGNSIKYTIIW